MWLDEEARTGVIVLANSRELDATFYDLLVEPLFAVFDTASTRSIHVVQFGGSHGNNCTPNAMNVAVGDTVEWIGDFAAHPLNSSTIPSGASAWQCDGGNHFFYVVQTPGVYHYYGGPEGSGMAGSFTAVATRVDDERSTPPVSFQLNQNYPNPFNPTATIRYVLPLRSMVRLTVFNTLGQQITTIVNGEMEAGYHETRFGGSRLASGVYLNRMQAGDFVETKKLILMR
jgi:plastocyanin